MLYCGLGVKPDFVTAFKQPITHSISYGDDCGFHCKFQQRCIGSTCAITLAINTAKGNRVQENLHLLPSCCHLVLFSSISIFHWPHASKAPPTAPPTAPISVSCVTKYIHSAAVCKGFSEDAYFPASIDTGRFCFSLYFKNEKHFLLFLHVF